MADVETVTVIRRPPKDNFGNRPAGATQQWDVPGCQFAPGPSQEMGVGGAQVDSDGTVYGPPVTDINAIVPEGIKPTDKIRVRGNDYHVEGDVQDWGSAGSVIVLKRVRG